MADASSLGEPVEVDADAAARHARAMSILKVLLTGAWAWPRPRGLTGPVNTLSTAPDARPLPSRGLATHHQCGSCVTIASLSKSRLESSSAASGCVATSEALRAFQPHDSHAARSPLRRVRRVLTTQAAYNRDRLVRLTRS
jgi:hypothetical protein